MRQAILGLDISTSIVGYTILDAGTGELLECSFVDLRPIASNLVWKLDYCLEHLIPVLEKYHIVYFGAEAALEMFSGGGTTAHTISILKAFNFGLTYGVYKILKIEPKYISFAEARKLANIKIPRAKKGTPASLAKKEKKEIIRKYCEQKYNNIVWTKNKNDNHQPWCYDMADSILIAEFLFNQFINFEPQPYFS